MTNYLQHMQQLGQGTAFARRKRYLEYNFSKYLNKLNKASEILEIGPGTGELLSILNERGINNLDIIDNDQAVLTYCHKEYRLRKAILSKSLDLTKVITKQKYDLIVLTQVFEHIPKSSYQNWIKTLYSSLKPNGVILITVPNGANPLSGTERYGDLQHENMFTIYSFQELMTFAGISSEEYQINGFYIPPDNPLQVVRIILQKILHIFFILLMIINGAIYQTLLTPNISLIISKK